LACNLIDFLYKYEFPIRLSIFFGAFTFFALWESLVPCRELKVNKPRRWLNNLGLIVTSTIVVRIIIPAAAIGTAYLVEQNSWGFANYFAMDYVLKAILTFVLLDLTIYFQHLFFHVLPILWRFHRVHHSDLDCDVTTGLRFHPVEILLSIVIKSTAIIILGAPVITVIIFEVILNFMSMFTHSNVYMNKKFEHVLRWFVTTPDMHRIHHSNIENEANSNFTFFISLWDRVFGTYLESPLKGHLNMSLGLRRITDTKYLNYLDLVMMPFRRAVRGYAINHRDTVNADKLKKINTQLTREIEIKEKQANELIFARDLAEKSNETKSKFISNITHELRTPMHAIQSYANFGVKRIETESLDKLLKYFTQIKSSGDRLLILIDNLLDLSKLESGTLTIHKVNANLIDIINTCINEQAAILEERGLTVKVNILSQATTAVFDTTLIGQVITNLLSNAIKFSPSNSLIDIKVFAQLNNTENKPMLYFSIQDEGVGIPNSELYDIFDSFNQSSRTETGAGGTGLGLAISKNIINSHQGDIWAENNVSNTGAIFTFAIPIN